MRFLLCSCNSLDMSALHFVLETKYYLRQNSGTNKMSIENICTRPNSIAKVQTTV